MLEKKIPDRIKHALNRYVDYGILPGHFLRAVLSNDLRAAVYRADPDSYAALKDIVFYVCRELPRGSFGSEENMLAWSEKLRSARDGSREEGRHEDSTHSRLASG